MKLTRAGFLKSVSVLPFIGGLLKAQNDMTVKVPMQPVPTRKSSINYRRLLRCIAEVETGNRDYVVGAKGERSRYQIKPELWYQYDNANHNTACYGSYARMVALRHVQWLDETLAYKSAIERNFREYAIAWCWNGGIESWRGPFKTGNKHINNYATRVTNLYDDPSFYPSCPRHLS